MVTHYKRRFIRSSTPIKNITICTLILLCGWVSAQSPELFSLTVMETGLGSEQGVYAVADISGDGKNDIVGAGNDPRLWWAPDSTPAHHYTIAENASPGLEIHTEDLDLDGDPDLITSEGGITWYENPRAPDGNPTADRWTKHECGEGAVSTDASTAEAHDFKTGDINGDGYPDAIERNNERTWTIYIHNGDLDDISFSVVTLDAANDVAGTALGDIDGDGDLDVSDGVAWFECPDNPLTDEWPRHDLGTLHTTTRVVIDDINADFNPDIIVAPAENGGSTMLWYEAPADPINDEWERHEVIVRDDPNFYTLQVGDINWDRKEDILLGTTGYHNEPWGKRIHILYQQNAEQGEWDSLQWHTELGVWQGVLADVSSDGDLDILSSNYQTGGQGEFWENKMNEKVFLTLLTPKTGSCYHQGDTLTVKWKVDTSRVRNPLYVDISVNGGITYHEFFKGVGDAVARDCTSIYTADTGTYHWVIPDSMVDTRGNTQSTRSSLCLIRIEEAYGSKPDGGGYMARSSEMFNIVGADENCNVEIRHKIRKKAVGSTRHSGVTTHKILGRMPGGAVVPFILSRQADGSVYIYTVQGRRIGRMGDHMQKADMDALFPFMSYK